MKKIPINMPQALAHMQVVGTARRGVNKGEDSDLPYIQLCTWYLEKWGAIISFTRDEGHHACGWWKNPEYERCWHLSISFISINGKPKPKNDKATLEIMKFIYGKNISYVWAESPYSKVGKKLEVWHYRVFVNPAWEPIIPKGEVYSTEFTEKGWRSFSELHSGKVSGSK